MNYNLDKLKQILNDSPEVAAAYLFGSAVVNESVVNDLDILILIYPGIKIHSAYFDLTERIAISQGVRVDKVDILFFDLQLADAEVLYEGLNKGILLKNDSPKLLSDRIEELSRYFMENEFLIQESKRLRKKRLEEFCAN